MKLLMKMAIKFAGKKSFYELIEKNEIMNDLNPQCSYCGYTHKESQAVNENSIFVNCADLKKMKKQIKEIDTFVLEDLRDALLEDERYEEVAVIEKELQKR